MVVVMHMASTNSTGIDLSKILVGKPKYWGQKVVKSDKCMGVSQLLGARARAAPQVYAYDRLHSWNHVRNFPVKPMHWFYNANCAMVQNTRILLLSCLRFIFPHCRSTFRCDLACIRNLIINNNKNNDFICNP